MMPPLIRLSSESIFTFIPRCSWDLEAGRQPEPGVAAHQDVIRRVDEELVLHLALLGQELGSSDLADGESLIADGNPRPARWHPGWTGRVESLWHPGDARVACPAWRIRFAPCPSCREKARYRHREQGAKTGTPSRPTLGLTTQNWLFFLEHAGGGIGQEFWSTACCSPLSSTVSIRPTSTSRERITVLPATMPSAVATVRVKLGPCEYQCRNSIQAPMKSASKAPSR